MSHSCAHFFSPEHTDEHRLANATSSLHLLMSKGNWFTSTLKKVWEILKNWCFFSGTLPCYLLFYCCFSVWFPIYFVILFLFFILIILFSSVHFLASNYFCILCAIKTIQLSNCSARSGHLLAFLPFILFKIFSFFHKILPNLNTLETLQLLFKPTLLWTCASSTYF